MHAAPSPFVRRHREARVPLPGEEAPRPNPAGTAVLVATLVFTGFMVEAEVGAPARFSAWTVGAGLAASVLIDWRWGGLRNLIRADLFGILALYFLIFFEFLFPQDYVGFVLHPESLKTATLLSLWGLGGLAVGRHLGNIRRSPFADLFTRPFPQFYMLVLFWLSVAIGYMHMLVAVQFNVIEMVEHFMGPRFSQPWSRGRLGDWRALLIELGLFLYLIPPLAGIIMARRQRYRNIDVWLVSGAFAFTLFYGFSSGTRNILASFLLTFMIGYAFALPVGRRKELVGITIGCALFLVVSTVLMLQFRQVGFTNYLRGERPVEEFSELSLSVDYNLFSMSRVVEVFPRRHPFLGWEVPYIALIRPIPRALWKGKPEGLSMTIEDAVGAEGWTVSTTYIGEAYMAGGTTWVVVISLVLGAMMGWWSHLASPRNSEFGMLIYASGFFAVAISMRSLFTFTTAILPTIGGIVIGRILLEKVRERRVDRRFDVSGQPGNRP